MTVILILTISLIYFLPSIVAYGRKNHTAAIFALNLLAGWTFIGWVAALVMALWMNNAAAKTADEIGWRDAAREMRNDARRLLRRPPHTV